MCGGGGGVNGRAGERECRWRARELDGKWEDIKCVLLDSLVCLVHVWFTARVHIKNKLDFPNGT